MALRGVIGGALIVLAACGGKVAATSSERPSPECSGGDCGGVVQPTPVPSGTASGGTDAGSICSQSRITIDCATDKGYALSTSRGQWSGAAEIHVVQMYESDDNRSSTQRRETVNVHVARKGHHELVLGSSTASEFTLHVEPGAFVDAITLTGDARHSVKYAPASTKIDDKSGKTPPCYDTAGCASYLAGEYTDFAACYHVTNIEIGDDPQPCSTPAQPWTPSDFVATAFSNGCSGGQKLVKYNPTYKKWVGAELCSPTRYKLFLGETKDGGYYEIGDTGGSGQDHCELVNPSFTLLNEDDITSGTCKTCNLDYDPSDARTPYPIYARGAMGTPFTLEQWRQSIDTSFWYECGVSIGN